MLFSARLLKKLKITDNILQLDFVVQEGQLKAFKAGQFVMVEVGDKRLRPYSIITLEKGDVIENFSFIVDTSPQGKASIYFEKLDEGSLTAMQGPLGLIYIAESAESYLFIATGTGIVPHIMFIRELLDIKKSNKPIKLIFGAPPKLAEIFEQELKDLQNNYPNFKHEFARVEHWLTNNYHPKIDQQIFICGGPEMTRQSQSIIFEIHGKKFGPENQIPKNIQIEVFN
jgi:ferredoxin-NADP reductase